MELEPILRLVQLLARFVPPAPILELALCLVRHAQLGPMLRLNHLCALRAVLVTNQVRQQAHARLARKVLTL